MNISSSRSSKTYEAHQETLKAGWGVRDAGPDEVRSLRQATTTRCNGAMAIDGFFRARVARLSQCILAVGDDARSSFRYRSTKDATTIRCDGAAIREILPPSIPLEPLGGELFAVQPIEECRRPQPWLAMAIISVSMQREQSSAQPIDAKAEDRCRTLGPSHRRFGSWLPKRGPPFEVDGMESDSSYQTTENQSWVPFKVTAGESSVPGLPPQRALLGTLCNPGLGHMHLQQEAIPDVISLRRFDS